MKHIEVLILDEADSIMPNGQDVNFVQQMLLKCPPVWQSMDDRGSSRAIIIGLSSTSMDDDVIGDLCVMDTTAFHTNLDQSHHVERWQSEFADPKLTVLDICNELGIRSPVVVNETIHLDAPDYDEMLFSFLQLAAELNPNKTAKKDGTWPCFFCLLLITFVLLCSFLHCA